MKLTNLFLITGTLLAVSGLQAMEESSHVCKNLELNNKFLEDQINFFMELHNKINEDKNKLTQNLDDANEQVQCLNSEIASLHAQIQAEKDTTKQNALIVKNNELAQLRAYSQQNAQAIQAAISGYEAQLKSLKTHIANLGKNIAAKNEQTGKSAASGK